MTSVSIPCVVRRWNLLCMEGKLQYNCDITLKQLRRALTADRCVPLSVGYYVTGLGALNRPPSTLCF